jgi:hypothetical protein
VTDQRLVCTIRDRRTGAERRIWLSHATEAWPHRVGSAPDCSIRIEDVPPLVAEIRGLSNHFFIRSLASLPIAAHGTSLAPGESARFVTCSIGDYTLHFDWTDDVPGVEAVTRGRP